MARPQSIRYLNEVRILELLMREGTISRANLSKALGISPSTMTKIVTELIGSGLVREIAGADAEPGEARPAGRPGVAIALDGAGAFFLGVEIGVRRLNLVVVDLTGKVIETAETALDMRCTAAEDVVAEIVAMTDRVCARLPKERLRGCGVSIPALVDHESTVEHAPIIGWKALPLGRLLKDRFASAGRDLRIEVVNDASALAMAEIARGTGKRFRTILFMNIENGVGGAIVDTDRLFGGNDGFAGEIGHLRVAAPGGDTAPEAQLEDLIGEDAALGLFARHGVSAATISEAAAALAAGDDGAQRAAEDWAVSLVRGLTSIVNVLNPGLVVIGGSAAPLFPFVADKVTASLSAALVQGLPVPQFETSGFGTSGPAIGAAQLVRQHLFVIDETALV